MRKFSSLLRDKKTQYVIIVWILILKVIEITTSLIAEVELLRFFAILGFETLSPTANIVWNGLVIIAVFWLILRLSKDMFQISVTLKSFSKREILGVTLLSVWAISAVVTFLQFASLATGPLADPSLEVSKYYSPILCKRDIEIFGWYWIDWGSNYYDRDFKMIRSMFVDGVFLLSDEHTFVSEPEAFIDAIFTAKQRGLEVGIIIFHPYDADFQEVWSLRVNQDKFSDFTINETWIQSTYKTKLRSVVDASKELNIAYYVYDDMNFGEATNLANAQLFIDVTNEITEGRALMLSFYPPRNLVIPNLCIMHWDWYSAPESVCDIRTSLEKRPSNNTSIGQFVWLHERTETDFQSLQKIYNELTNASRVEILAMRFGAPSWSNGLANSILEHPVLIEYLTLLNMKLKGIENSVKLNRCEINKVTLDLSRSTFACPFSIYGTGQTSEYGTKYVGASYFRVKNLSIEQEVIEMRFCGNGSNGLQGWFAYRISLQNPLPTSENSTFILLLRLTASLDGTAWTYVKMDFLSKENEPYSLTWKFHDVPMNYVYSSHNGTRNNYLLGSITDWRFYQFDFSNVFYTSFSRHPRCITCIEYGVGAEADNDITVQFLLSRISSQPLEVNEERVETARHNIHLKDDYVRVTGLYTTKLFVILTPNPPQKNTSIQLSLLEISRSELYAWNTSSFFNMTEMKLCLTLLGNSTEVFLNGEKATPTYQYQQSAVYTLDPKKVEVTLIVINKTNVYLLSFSVIAPIAAFLYYAFRQTKHYRRIF